MSKKILIVSLAVLCAALCSTAIAVAADGDEAPTASAPATPAAPAPESARPESETGPRSEALPADLGVPEPMPLFGCPSSGGCDYDFECISRPYHCPLGEAKGCFDSSGTGSCDGWCGCAC